MSLSSELIVGYVHMFATMFEVEQRASLHQAKKRSLLEGYQGHDALLDFYEKFFKKILTTVSRPIARAKGFLMETRSCEK
jgi:hypothetical protein